jgi:beta-glucosidase
MLARAVTAAREADAVVLLVGETSDSSVESKDRADTRLAPEQLRLIEAVCAANPRTAAIVNVGHGFDAEWAENCAALLVAWYPGQGFAHALASVLAGEREPGGRMPVSIARSETDYCGYDLQPAEDGTLDYGEGVLMGYRGLMASQTPARHAFGSGFGYARFEWSEARAEGEVVTVLVRNVSDRPGSEVVQLYRNMPETALIGFAKVHLAPGEERRIRIMPLAKALRTWADGWQPLPRPLALRVARSVEDPGLAVAL